jgi:hygromycin-B 7''-O-kinase
MPQGGMVNHAWAIGEDFVLRICASAEARDEAPRECALVPFLIEAGIDIPRLVAADPQGEFIGAPYTIYETARGVLMGYCDFEPAALEGCYRQIGRELARLHQVEVPEALRPMLRRGDPIVHEKPLARAIAEGLLTGVEAVANLAPPSRHCLIHQDIHPWNVFIEPDLDRLTAIIDWGDATWGPPACEFSSMPMPAVAPMLEGYVEEGGMVDEGFVQRSLYHGLALGLWEISKLPVVDFDRRWWRMPPGGWEEMKEWIAKISNGTSVPEA